MYMLGEGGEELLGGGGPSLMSFDCVGLTMAYTPPLSQSFTTHDVGGGVPEGDRGGGPDGQGHGRHHGQ